MNKSEGQNRNHGRSGAYYVNASGDLVPVPVTLEADVEEFHICDQHDCKSHGNWAPGTDVKPGEFEHTEDEAKLFKPKFKHTAIDDNGLKAVNDSAKEIESAAAAKRKGYTDAARAVANQKISDATGVHQSETATENGRFNTAMGAENQRNKQRLNAIQSSYQNDTVALKSELKKTTSQMDSGYRTWEGLDERISEAYGNLRNTEYQWDSSAGAVSNEGYPQGAYLDNYGNQVNRGVRDAMEREAADLRGQIRRLEDQKRNGDQRYGPIQNRYHNLSNQISSRDAQHSRELSAESSLNNSNRKAIESQHASTIRSIDAKLSAAKNAAESKFRSEKKSADKEESDTMAKVNSILKRGTDDVAAVGRQAQKDRDEVKLNPNDVLSPEERLKLLQPEGKKYNEPYAKKATDSIERIRTEAGAKVAQIRKTQEADLSTVMAGVRVVRTPEGAERYGVSIGQAIKPKAPEKAKREKAPKSYVDEVMSSAREGIKSIPDQKAANRVLADPEFQKELSDFIDERYNNETTSEEFIKKISEATQRSLKRR